MATMVMTGMMRAICIHDFGGPEVMRYEEVHRPEPGPGQVLVKVHAAGVNPVDWKIREGYLGQLPLPQILGNDISGVVEAVGPGVTQLHPGDAVFGVVADESGAYAEHAISSPQRLAHRPEQLDEITAAALPTASMTAWQALFDVAGLREDHRILIHAAAGGVGSFGVQFVKYADAHVIGTASIQNEHYLRELGLDEFIDYHSVRFEDVVENVDIVFDTVGGETQKRSWKVLKPGGIMVSVVQPPSEEEAKAHGARGVFMRSDHNRGDELERIAHLVVSGQVKVHVATVLPLHEARKALEMSETGHTRGKLVLKVEG